MLLLLFLLIVPAKALAQTEVKSPQAADRSEKASKTTMIKSFFTGLKGDWSGKYALWLRPDMPAQRSNIRAEFSSAASGNYFLMKYSWKRGDKPHDGVFLFWGQGNSANASWGDSFHSVPNPLKCEGAVKDGGKKIVMMSTYSVGSGPEWGWRTEFTRTGPDSLLMEAYNILPSGVEALAVRAVMKRN